MAREYLLCYDLLTCDLYSFMDDYVPGKDSSDIYQEAAVIWLNVQYNDGTGNVPDIDVSSYGITDATLDRLQQYYRYPDRYKSTYWYYFTNAME